MTAVCLQFDEPCLLPDTFHEDCANWTLSQNPKLRLMMELEVVQAVTKIQMFEFSRPKFPK